MFVQIEIKRLMARVLGVAALIAIAAALPAASQTWQRITPPGIFPPGTVMSFDLDACPAG